MAAEAIESHKGRSENALGDTAHAVFSSSRASKISPCCTHPTNNNACRFRRAEAARAALRGRSTKTLVASDHAIFARLCGPNAERVGIEAAAVALKSGTCAYVRVETDHAEFEISCGLKADRRGSADAAIASNSGLSSNTRPAYDQAGLAS